ANFQRGNFPSGHLPPNGPRGAACPPRCRGRGRPARHRRRAAAAAMAAPQGRDTGALPFPTSVGYVALATNGAKGGGTKYLTLQFLNFARWTWTTQQHSCNVSGALRVMARENLYTK
ncbi:unnamed protein product, partial [Prorocentrum cordatum]